MADVTLYEFNGTYLPPSLLSDTTDRKVFTGGIDPSSVPGAVLITGDLWNTTVFLGSLFTVTDNGDGTLSVSGTSVTDNGDGTLTLNDTGVTDNGDGTLTLIGA